jgi:hypothetical protein
MDIKYYCTNLYCSYPGKNNFEREYGIEMVMDTNNFAGIFCPFCKKTMVQKKF